MEADAIPQPHQPIAFTRAKIAEAVAGGIDVSRRDADAIVDAIFSSVAGALNRGDKVELRGFGSFRSHQRGARVDEAWRSRMATNSAGASGRASPGIRVVFQRHANAVRGCEPILLSHLRNQTQLTRRIRFRQPSRHALVQWRQLVVQRTPQYGRLRNAHEFGHGLGIEPLQTDNENRHFCSKRCRQQIRLRKSQATSE